MVIRVSDSRVYRFSANSTVIAEVHDGYAEVLVLPERRRFSVSLETVIRSWREYANKQSKDALASYLADRLASGVLRVDEEVLS